jgi:hypothetical protein
MLRIVKPIAKTSGMLFLVLFTQGESGAGPEEFAAVMRTLVSRETFQ